VIEGQDGESDERLSRIEALTDTSLSQLEPDDLLDELLDRVRVVLHCDTAAILLLDQHAQQLVAVAAKGLPQQARDGFRVAVGQGFAGRIAALKQPLAVPQVRPADVVNPQLVEAGIRSLLGVPMFAAGELIGVLQVGCRTPREFAANDIRLLRLAADRAGAATQAQAIGIDRTAALALQRSLLPARLSDAPGIESAARYVPGHDSGVGGDWYDVFTLPSGWLGVVIGDVSGHGLRSAVVMGRLRSALRAYTLVTEDPAQTLTLLGRKVHHFEAGNLATVLYATISPDRSTVRISLAGHLRPVLAVPGQPVVVTDLPVDPPLGLGPRQPHRRYTELPLPTGSVLVCYTDGLVERRGEVIDTGIERLRAAVVAEPAEQVCDTVMAAVARKHPDDDIALLTIRTI
jgi:phosphoserine phosphatase RsbU/P